jgi:hypothetical protein
LFIVAVLCLQYISDINIDDEDTLDELPWYLRYKVATSVLPLGIFFLLCSVVLTYLEDWHFVTALYVSAQIVTTIGYGDVTAKSASTQWFMTFYVLVIILFFASIVSDLADSMMASNASALRDQVSTLFSDRAAAVERSQEDEASENASKPPEQESPRATKPSAAAVERSQEDEASENASKPPEQESPRATKPSDEGQSGVPWAEKYLMKPLVTSVGVFLGFVLFGSIFYSIAEDCSCSFGITRELNYPDCIDSGPHNNCATKGVTKTWGECFYMSVITMTTVGFGDYTPVTRLGRYVGIVWMVPGIVATANMVTCIASTKSAAMKQWRRDVQKPKALLKKIGCKEDAEELSKVEFLKYMLVKLDMLNIQDIECIEQVFDSHDSGTGKIRLEAFENAESAID